jgi:hypothetical protein
MSEDPKLNLTFRWEGLDRNNQYTVDDRRLEVESHGAAVKLGVSHLALYFRDAATPDSPRQFTNVFEISDAQSLAEKLEGYRSVELDAKTISRMFSRVSEKPQEQKKFGGVSSLDEAIAVLKAEPPETVFVIPSNGGFIKMEDGDTAYGPKGEQIWPPAKKQSSGFTLDIR